MKPFKYVSATIFVSMALAFASCGSGRKPKAYDPGKKPVAPAGKTEDSSKKVVGDPTAKKPDEPDKKPDPNPGIEPGDHALSIKLDETGVFKLKFYGTADLFSDVKASIEGPVKSQKIAAATGATAALSEFAPISGPLLKVSFKYEGKECAVKTSLAFGKSANFIGKEKLCTP